MINVWSGLKTFVVMVRSTVRLKFKNNWGHAQKKQTTTMTHGLKRKMNSNHLDLNPFVRYLLCACHNIKTTTRRCCDLSVIMFWDVY